MSTFILGLLGVIVGLALVGAIVWFWIKRKVGRFLVGLGEAIGLGGAVPPFRITLEPSSDLEWTGRDTVDSITAALEAIGYVRAGDFLVAEMGGVKLRGLVNGEACTLAALYEHPQIDTPLLDLLGLHQDRHHVLVTTAPDDGLDTPPSKTVHRAVNDLAEREAVGPAVGAMHETLLADSAGRQPIAIGPTLFPLTFATAYAAEMDWRISRGGVTAEEVRGAAAAGGQEPPDEDSIERVQRQWRSAISDFVGEETQRAFLAAGSVLATDWEEMRDRVLVVHEHSERSDLVESLAAHLLDAESNDDEEDDEDEDEDEEDRYEVLEAQVRAAFDGAGVVEGFDAALEAFPALAAYEHIGDVDRPWRGRIYVLPRTA